MTVATGSILANDLLQACRERAAGYDRDNRFCQEDFDQLKAAGYLRMAIPKEFGGLGLTLAEAGRETRRLANHAPATALCINMHHYWVGTAADVWRSGNKSLEWISATRRGRGVRGRPCRERQRNVAVLINHESGARGRGLQVHRAQVVRQPDAGVDAARPSRDGHQRSREPEDRPRLPRSLDERRDDQGDLGRDGHARHAKRRHDSRGRVRPRLAHRKGLSDWPRRRRLLRAGDLRLGAGRLLECLLWPRTAHDRAGR